MKTRTIANKKPDCITWQGYIRPDGYGQIDFEGKRWLAHRFVYQKIYGPIPENKMVLHNCDYKSCCNPKHLRLGNATDNMKDALERGQIIGAMNSKLSTEEVKRIREIDLPQQELADRFNTTQGTISRIKSGSRRGLVV